MHSERKLASITGKYLIKHMSKQRRSEPTLLFGGDDMAEWNSLDFHIITCVYVSGMQRSTITDNRIEMGIPKSPIILLTFKQWNRGTTWLKKIWLGKMFYSCPFSIKVNYFVIALFSIRYGQISSLGAQDRQVSDPSYLFFIHSNPMDKSVQQSEKEIKSTPYLVFLWYIARFKLNEHHRDIMHLDAVTITI